MRHKQMKVKESTLEEAFSVHKQIPEFAPSPPFTLREFEDETGNKKCLILVSFLDNKPAGYSISYDKFGDGSLYHWMAGVIPEFRDKGLYKKMESYLENWAQKSGFQSIKVKTWNRRIEMRVALAKSGYNIVELQEKPDVLDNRLMHEKIL